MTNSGNNKGREKQRGKCFLVFVNQRKLVSCLKSGDFHLNLNSGGKKVRKGRKPPFSCLYEWEEIFQAALNYDFHRNVNCDFHHNLNNDFWWKILVRNKEILALMNQRRIFTILENLINPELCWKIYFKKICWQQIVRKGEKHSSSCFY